MDQNISVTSESISSALSQFQAEMGKMDTLFNTVQTTTSQVKSYWDGDDSDAMLAQINAFQKSFEDVKNENKKYATFLNTVINKYSTAEKNISNTIDSGSAGFSINGS